MVVLAIILAKGIWPIQEGVNERGLERLLIPV